MTRLKLLKIAFSVLFLVGSVTVYAHLPSSDVLETQQPTATATLSPQERIEAQYPYTITQFTLNESLLAVESATPSPTPLVVKVTISDEMAEKLELALNQELDDTIYTTEEEYFGDGDLSSGLPEAPTVVLPTATPTVAPTATPTVAPTATPTAAPTATPTATPTEAPTATPTEGEGEGDEAGGTATATPTAAPTATPTTAPTATPTATPTAAPTATPTAAPQIPVLTVTDSSLTSYSQISLYNSFADEYKTFTYAVSEAYGVSYELLLAIMYNESRFTVNATNVNTNGTVDRGLMQINEVCFSTLNTAIGLPSLDALYDPGWNITSGAYLIYYYMARYGYSELDALLCYQCGYTGAQSYFASGNRPVSYTNVTTNLAIYQSANLT